MDFLKINGGYGEGGGQIIRSAITLSCITKQPIHLENIRKNRKDVGLKPQHLTAIRILQKISNADVIGAEIGSTELKFIPGKIENLELIEDVKTAGSISLILQVLIPVVSISQKNLV
jgi:RNA 3''-terminal phosphate cyclase